MQAKNYPLTCNLYITLHGSLQWFCNATLNSVWCELTKLKSSFVFSQPLWPCLCRRLRQCKQLFGLHWIGWNKKPAYHIAHACFVLLLAVSFCLLTCHTIWETTDLIRDFYWKDSNCNFQYFSNRKEHVIWVVKAIFRFNNTKTSFRLKSSPVICTIRPQDNETKVV